MPFTHSTLYTTLCGFYVGAKCLSLILTMESKSCGFASICTMHTPIFGKNNHLRHHFFFGDLADPIINYFLTQSQTLKIHVLVHFEQNLTFTDSSLTVKCLCLIV